MIKKKEVGCHFLNCGLMMPGLWNIMEEPGLQVNGSTQRISRFSKKTPLSKQRDLRGKQLSWLSLRTDRGYIKLTCPPALSFSLLKKYFFERWDVHVGAGYRLVRGLLCNKTESVAAENKKKGGGWVALQWGEVFNEQLFLFFFQALVLHCSMYAGFPQICYYICGHGVLLWAQHCTVSSFHSVWFPFSFLILTKGMKAHVFVRPNSELHKSQATPDSNAVDVDQLPLPHAALCSASLKGSFSFLQAQPLQPNVHFRALWHIQR